MKTSQSTSRPGFVFDPDAGFWSLNDLIAADTPEDEECLCYGGDLNSGVTPCDISDADNQTGSSWGIIVGYKYFDCRAGNWSDVWPDGINRSLVGHGSSAEPPVCSLTNRELAPCG